MLAVLGSTALNHYKQTRTPVDLDLLGTYDDIQDYIKKVRANEKVLSCIPIDSGKKIVLKTDKRIVEFEIAWEGSNSEELLRIIENDYSEFHSDEFSPMLVPCLNILYTLKMSHRYKKNSPHFLKTMDDIILIRSLGAWIPEEYEGWFQWREKETYTNKLPSLNQSKKDFFDNSADIYTLNHDDIHLAVKHLEVPAYEMFKADAKEVMCSKDLFFSCSRQVQLYAALEEAYVLSLERSIHPFPDVDKKWAFDTALMKLASSISSGWFREFVWEEYYEIQKFYNVEYVDRFYKALEEGKIRAFNGETY